jgi:predicted DNA-binding transcriptional regulator AlpA
MVEKLGELECIAGEEVMTAKQVCTLLNISRTTLHNKLKNDDSFPRSVAITPGKKRWKVREVESWINEKMGVSS